MGREPKLFGAGFLGGYNIHVEPVGSNMETIKAGIIDNF